MPGPEGSKGGRFGGGARGGGFGCGNNGGNTGGNHNENNHYGNENYYRKSLYYVKTKRIALGCQP